MKIRNLNFLIPLALTGGGSWEIGPTYLPPGTYLPEPPGGLKHCYAIDCIFFFRRTRLKVYLVENARKGLYT